MKEVWKCTTTATWAELYFRTTGRMQTSELPRWGVRGPGSQSSDSSAEGCSQVLLTPQHIPPVTSTNEVRSGSQRTSSGKGTQRPMLESGATCIVRAVGTGRAPRASAIQTLTDFILQKPYEVGTITFLLFPKRTQSRRVRNGICCFYPVSISSLCW